MRGRGKTSLQFPQWDCLGGIGAHLKFAVMSSLLLFWSHSIQDLSSLRGIKPTPPAVGVGTLNHWTCQGSPDHEFKVKPVGPVVKTQRFHSCGSGFDPVRSCKPCSRQKKKKKKSQARLCSPVSLPMTNKHAIIFSSCHSPLTPYPSTFTPEFLCSLCG